MKTNPMTYYYPISPDGIEIDHNQYPTRRKALNALKRWSKRYEAQGHYTTARRERIPAEDLLDYCSIIDVNPRDIPW